MTSITRDWYAFRAYNSQAVYGFGTAANADRYADTLTGSREINVYHPTLLTDAEVDELKLNTNPEAVDLDNLEFDV